MFYGIIVHRREVIIMANKDVKKNALSDDSLDKVSGGYRPGSILLTEEEAQWLNDRGYKMLDRKKVSASPSDSIADSVFDFTDAQGSPISVNEIANLLEAGGFSRG